MEGKKEMSRAAVLDVLRGILPDVAVNVSYRDRLFNCRADLRLDECGHDAIFSDSFMRSLLDMDGELGKIDSVTITLGLGHGV